MLKTQDQVKKPTSWPLGEPKVAIQGQDQKIRKIAVSTTFWKGKKSFFVHIIQDLNSGSHDSKKTRSGPFLIHFWPKKGKKGQNVERLPEFVCGWIFCFSLVFNYFSLFPHGIFVKSLNFEIESCTEPKTLGRSIYLEFASHQCF